MNIKKPEVIRLKSKYGSRITSRNIDGSVGVNANIPMKEIIKRLAAYEDTGLTPEEIIKLKGHKHGLTHTRLYTIWKSMRQRCFSKQHKDFKRYGGRGITICEEWKNSFQAFYDWALAHGYADNLSIDRIDNDGNYCPENCQWADSATQAKNRRFAHITYNGETHTIEEWSKITGISNSGIRYRIQQNYPVEKILAPAKKGGADE